MKRITYISRFSRTLSHIEIDEIGHVAQKNNKKDNITGVFICSSGVFFQTIEGDDEKIDRLFTKIKHDPRHKDLICLKTEKDIGKRQYPDWSMKMLNLDDSFDDTLMIPIRSLFQVLTESNSILKRYTQPTILDFISDGINPLTIASREVNKIILFCDIVAFSYLSTVLSVRETVSLVNTYLSECAEILLRSGGEVAKYVGDCVMAYFDWDKADATIQAGEDILRRLAEIRKKAPAKSPLNYLFTGIGIACGQVVEGNIGSSSKMEYTIIGDAVNLSSSLENLTRRLPKAMAISSGVKDLARKPWPFVSMGTHQIKKRHHPVEVFSIDTLHTGKSDNPLEVIEQINTLEKR